MAVRYQYQTLNEIRTMVTSGVDRTYNLFGLVKRDNGTNPTVMARSLLVKDQNDVLGKVSVKVNRDDLPNVKVGDVIRVHRARGKIYLNQLELNVPTPFNVVIYPKDGGGYHNPLSTSRRATVEASDEAIVNALFQLGYSVPEENTLSSIEADGKSYEIVCQLVGHRRLNDGSRFVFLWDGTMCKACDLKRFRDMPFDDHMEIFDYEIARCAGSRLHHFHIFDNFAAFMEGLQPRTILYMDGVRIVFSQKHQECFLSIKGPLASIRALPDDHPSSLRLLQRLALFSDVTESRGEESDQSMPDLEENAVAETARQREERAAQTSQVFPPSGETSTNRGKQAEKTLTARSCQTSPTLERELSSHNVNVAQTSSQRAIDTPVSVKATELNTQCHTASKSDESLLPRVTTEDLASRRVFERNMGENVETGSRSAAANANKTREDLVSNIEPKSPPRELVSNEKNSENVNKKATVSDRNTTVQPRNPPVEHEASTTVRPTMNDVINLLFCPPNQIEDSATSASNDKQHEPDGANLNETSSNLVLETPASSENISGNSRSKDFDVEAREKLLQQIEEQEAQEAFKSKFQQVVQRFITNASALKSIAQKDCPIASTSTAASVIRNKRTSQVERPSGATSVSSFQSNKRPNGQTTRKRRHCGLKSSAPEPSKTGKIIEVITIESSDDEGPSVSTTLSDSNNSMIVNISETSESFTTTLSHESMVVHHSGNVESQLSPQSPPQLPTGHGKNHLNLRRRIVDRKNDTTTSSSSLSSNESQMLTNMQENVAVVRDSETEIKRNPEVDDSTSNASGTPHLGRTRRISEASHNSYTRTQDLENPLPGTSTDCKRKRKLKVSPSLQSHHVTYCDSYQDVSMTDRVKIAIQKETEMNKRLAECGKAFDCLVR